MSDIKLFALNDGDAKEIPGSASPLEKSLQLLIERNLETMLGLRLLGSEYATGPKYGGRIDTLAIDENASPVIIEYKRATNENVINQGLFYLDWLLDHRAEFKLLVIEKRGKESAETIDWTAPRLLCIAGGFTRYDEHAVQQMNRNIELIRYRRFGDGLLMLELVNAIVAKQEGATNGKTPSPAGTNKTISETLQTLDGTLQDLFQALRAHLLALGDDVQEKTLKNYVAFTEKRRPEGGAPLPHPAVLKFRGQPLHAHQPPDQQPATVAPICVRSGTAPAPAVGQGWNRTQAAASWLPPRTRSR